MRCAILLALSTLAPAQRMAPVPFVGCKADTMVGPADAPSEPENPPLAAADVAPKLAYYQSAVMSGVLAPRGWQCSATMGSSGSTLLIEGPSGAAVRLIFRDGETSGRYDVASVIARVFPAFADFAKSAGEDGIGPKLVFAPYPADNLTYKNKSVVEFRTPANREGLGTDTGLTRNGLSIEGVAIFLSPPPGLFLLAVRLPPDLARLAPAIVEQVERDTLKK